MDRLSRVSRTNRLERLNFVIQHSQSRMYEIREEPAFIRLSSSEFVQIHRLTPETFVKLSQLLEDDLRPKTRRSHSLSVNEQLEIALRFYASGTFQSVVGFSSKVKQPTVSRVVSRVTDAIIRHSSDMIKWPTLQQQRHHSQAFQQFKGMPNVIGCVDGTHVRLVNRPEIHEEAYINRKQYHSINAMITCDSELRIIDLDTR